MKQSNPSLAQEYFVKAEKCDSAYCFPNRIEEVLILQEAVRQNPSDAKSFYYLGNFWYASRRYENAVSCWEQSATIDPEFPTVWRNLSLAYYNKGKQFPSLILTNISSSMDSVLLPTMSTVQDDKKLVRNMLSRSIKLSAFVIFPLLFGLSGISKLMVKILLTEKWGLCVPYMNIFCIACCK